MLMACDGDVMDAYYHCIRTSHSHAQRNVKEYREMHP